MKKTTNFINLYQIVPVNDGYNRVYRDSCGKHLLEHKASGTKKCLAFYSEEIAQSYIDKYLDSNAYETEMCTYNVKYLPDDIIEEVDARSDDMNNLKNLQTMNIDKFVEFLDSNGHHDAIWWKWFEETYCEKCPTETVHIDEHEGEHIWKTECECSYCEIHDKCRFFQEMDDVPDSKETIKLWLESETTDEEV